MEILWTILIGFIVGVIAKFLMPGKDPGGFIITTVLGIAGSWVGGWISGMLGGSGVVGWIGSILGAMLLLWVYRKMNKQAA
jgi:uncharacterized membrane protein YeaQ/YmgE (transglycosylase-associated protein family)